VFLRGHRRRDQHTRAAHNNLSHLDSGPFRLG
jgi:hypothetical protein